MNQELDDEYSGIPYAHVDEDPGVEVEYLTGREKAVLYIILSVVCLLCLWGAWKFMKAIWHGLVWLVTR